MIGALLALPTRPVKVKSTQYEQRDVTVHGMRLRYIDVRPPDPADQGNVLLLIHGLTSRIEEYENLMPLLSQHHRVLVVDLPGSGYSDKPNRAYSLKFYEDTLLGFLDALGIQRTHVGGGSLGGNLTLRLGKREPERFDRLAAWAPAGAWEPSRMTGLMCRMFGGETLFWPTVWGQSRYWYEKAWPGRRQALEETFTYYREVLTKGFVRMYWELAIDQVEHSLFGMAHEVKQRTLLAVGDRDNGMNLHRGVHRLRELIPRSELKVFKGARHSLASEIPGPLAELVNEFLRRKIS